MLDDDDAWRAEVDARVVASEMVFGMRREATGASPGPGGAVMMRGSADKIDERADGTLYVTDVKTGSQRTFKEITKTSPTPTAPSCNCPSTRTRRGSLGDRARRSARRTGSSARTAYNVHRPDRRRSRSGTPTPSAPWCPRSRSGLFPEQAPEVPDFAWVQCPYCNPDGIGHGEVRERWERKRRATELESCRAILGPVEPDVLRIGADDQRPLMTQRRGSGSGPTPARPSSSSGRWLRQDHGRWSTGWLLWC